MAPETPASPTQNDSWRTAAGLLLARTQSWASTHRSDAGFRIATVTGSLGLLLALLLFMGDFTRAAPPTAHIAAVLPPATPSITATNTGETTAVEQVLLQLPPDQSDVFPLKMEVADADDAEVLEPATTPELTFDLEDAPVEEPAEPLMPELEPEPRAEQTSLAFAPIDDDDFPRLPSPPTAPVMQVAEEEFSSNPELPPASEPVQLQLPVEDDDDFNFAPPAAPPEMTEPLPEEEFSEPQEEAPLPATPSEGGWRKLNKKPAAPELAAPLPEEMPEPTDELALAPEVEPLAEDELPVETFEPATTTPPAPATPASPPVDEDDEDNFLPQKPATGWRQPGAKTPAVQQPAPVDDPPIVDQPAIEEEDSFPAEPPAEPVEEPALPEEEDTAPFADEEPVVPQTPAAPPATESAEPPPADPVPAVRNPPAQPDVERDPQLELRLSAPESAAVGQLFPVDIEITNHGNTGVKNVSLYITLPPQCLHHAGRQIEYRAGFVEAGQTHRARMRVLAVAPGQATSEAEASSGPVVWPSRSVTINLHPAPPSAPTGTPADNCQICPVNFAPTWWLCP